MITSKVKDSHVVTLYVYKKKKIMLRVYKNIYITCKQRKENPVMCKGAQLVNSNLIVS